MLASMHKPVLKRLRSVFSRSTKDLNMLIQPKFLSLSDLLANRLFRIPQYQRSYSWQRKHRHDMFEDIKLLREQPDTRHFMATVVGLSRGRTTIVTDEYSVIEVVDGQQRLTTLIILPARQKRPQHWPIGPYWTQSKNAKCLLMTGPI